MPGYDNPPAPALPPATAPSSLSDISMRPAGLLGSIFRSASLRLIRYSSSFQARSTSNLHIQTSSFVLFFLFYLKGFLPEHTAQRPHWISLEELTFANVRHSRQT